MGTVPQTDEARQLHGAPPESTDFANYFCTYAFLFHQKDMLEDHKRTGCYYEAVMKNQDLFKEKVVLDVGTGSGILALFAAKAGAKKVYAVEATDVARHAKTLLKANNVADRVVVIQGTMESIELPEKVDIIISEWMGYFLLRESMLDSVLVARNKFLKPGGSLFPSHANMYIAPISSQRTGERDNEYRGAIAGWNCFVRQMYEYYGVDMGCLNQDYDKEQHTYYRRTAEWSQVHPHQLFSAPVRFRSIDLLTVTLDEVKAAFETDVEFQTLYDGQIDALCGFFDVTFAGSPEHPAQYPVILSTAPEHGTCTHWGQLSFHCIPGVRCEKGGQLPMKLRLVRREDNHRLMNLSVEYRPPGRDPVPFDFFIE